MTGALEELNEVETFDLETLAFDESKVAEEETRRVAIDVRELRKSYGALEAVRGVSLEIRAGEVFGLIGPDGAGKSSVFQILGGVMAQTDGAAEMYGVSARDARPFVGYLTQTFSLYQDMTVLENLRYIGELRRLPRADIEARGLHYLSMFDMERFTDRLAGSLSGGMKQKLALACALISEPKILLLDEPTTGVDPVSRREFWDTLVHLSGQGMTIVVATPYLDEAERCTRVALMFDGQIQQTGTPAEIRRGLGLERLEVHASDLGRAEDLLAKVEGIDDVQRFGDRLDLMVKDPARGEELTRAALDAAGLETRGVRHTSPTLENAFVSILRAQGGSTSTPAFPRRRQFRERAADAVAIGARSLHKRFGSFHAVKDVNIEVKYGEIYGLLGANGAGKTTTIKILCGLLAPSSGEMELAGERGSLRSSFVRQRLGYMSQKFSLYDDLTIEENLDFFAGVYGVPREEREEKKRWVLAVSGLEGRGHMLTASLPGGWKQRVAFGAAVMHEPSVLFLDEPTSGVDPLARRAFWKMINSFADRGVAVLVTTHYLEEAEQCNRLGFMVAGELVAQGTPTGIKAEQGGHLIELVTDRPQSAADLLKESMERWRVSLFGDRLHVIVDEAADAGVRNITQRLGSANIQVLKAHEESYSLEDVFIAVVEKAKNAGAKK
ncbi:MAG TPA: ATP-binding cassette domain-containing protein [Pyrinomonadaceae bacterium]|jgi:ABC-2 type transport system ATP-binding protein|nr:ATP-binding cassette domain-containing protein [Pyrinomonadaceae bacterium]